MTPRGRRIGLVVLTALLTGLLVLLALNLTIGDSRVDRRVESLYGTDSPQFLRAMGVLLGPPLVGGNTATALLNGDEIFPSMLEAIRGAERTIDFETYVYWEGRVGKEFADALSERARSGVKVNLLLDWVGSQRMDEDALAEMEEAGVEIRRYHPLHWYTLDRLNNRTHRKILVVDGRIGFTGGVGIADSWDGHAQDPDHWRDTHFRFEGPVVAQMQSAFLDNWVEITGTVVHGEEYFPPIADAGDYRAQVFTSSPGGGAETAEMMYLLSIAAARTSIDLSMAYFIPDDVSLRAFLDARKRGVRIRIITPGPHIDSNIVRRASRAAWGPLLEAGVEMHEYQPTLYHCKVMIVDDLWTTVGSTNFDSRSFSVNDEANLNVYDAEFGRAQRRIFEEDLKQSRRITLGEWQRRPLRERLVERFSVLLNAQL